MTETLAVIVPVYGEKEIVGVLYNRLISTLKTLPVKYQIIYVNDACPYGSGEELKKLAEKDPNVTLITFSKNFGESNAVKAGIDNCNADYAVIMDCDLQDLPEDIPALYNKAKEGYDIVWGERVRRKDTPFKKFCSNMFYILSNIISEIKIDKKIGSFSIISKNVIEELKKVNDYTFNYIQMVEYLGFKKTYIPILKEQRPIGKTAYSLTKAALLALNIMVSTSNKPLLIPIISSFTMFGLCLFLIILYTVVTTLDINLTYDRYFIMAIISLFFAGILFLNIGILGVYIGVILKETLTKPKYVIKDRIN